MDIELRAEVREEVRAEVERIYHRPYVRTMATVCWLLFGATMILIVAPEL